MTSFRDWTPVKADEHNAKVARDAQAARSNPRPVRKLNDERNKPNPEMMNALNVLLTRPETTQKPSPCAADSPTCPPKPEKASEQPTVWRFVINGQPMGAPRMTQSDKWRKRPCVLRYREWCDRAMASAPSDMTKEPARISMQAFLEMPESWSKKKRTEMRGQLHRQKPDIDNLGKSCADSLFPSDCMIAMMTLLKRWDDGNGPRVEIEVQA